MVKSLSIGCQCRTISILILTLIFLSGPVFAEDSDFIGAGGIGAGGNFVEFNEIGSGGHGIARLGGKVVGKGAGIVGLVEKEERVDSGETPDVVYAGMGAEFLGARYATAAVVPAVVAACTAALPCLGAAALGAAAVYGASKVAQYGAEALVSSLNSLAAGAINREKEGNFSPFMNSGGYFDMGSLNVFAPDGSIIDREPDLRRTIDEEQKRAARAQLDRRNGAQAGSNNVRYTDENLGPVGSRDEFIRGLAQAAIAGALNGLVNGAFSEGSSPRGRGPCSNGHTQACWDWINKTARGLPNRGPTLGRIVPSR